MSLTNDDLQAIGKLIDQKLDKKLDEKLEPIKQKLDEHSKTLKYLKTKVNRLNKTVDIIGGTYDERIVKNSREIDKIKKHIKLPLAY